MQIMASRSVGMVKCTAAEPLLLDGLEHTSKFVVHTKVLIYSCWAHMCGSVGRQGVHVGGCLKRAQ